MVGVKRLFCVLGVAAAVLARSMPLRSDSIKSTHGLDVVDHPSFDFVKISITHHDASSRKYQHSEKRPFVAKPFGIKSNHQQNPQHMTWKVGSQGVIKNQIKPKSILDGLDTLKTQFNMLSDTLNSLARSFDPQVKIREAFSQVFITLKSCQHGDFTIKGDEGEGRAVSKRLDAILTLSEKVKKTVEDKSRFWEPKFKNDMPNYFRSLSEELERAGQEFLDRIDGGSQAVSCKIWSLITKNIDDATSITNKTEFRSSWESNQKQPTFTQLTDQKNDDNKAVNIIGFLTDTRSAIIDVSKGLKDYKPYDNKEGAIDKAMDKLDDIFNLHHNFSKHELSNDSQKKLGHLLHDLSFSTDDLYDMVIEKRKHFEYEYATGLGKRFHTLQKSGEELTEWVGQALNAVWRDKNLEYWKHTTSVFGAVRESLGDLEDENTPAIVRSTRGSQTPTPENGKISLDTFLTRLHLVIQKYTVALKSYRSDEQQKETDVATAAYKFDDIIRSHKKVTFDDGKEALTKLNDVDVALTEFVKILGNLGEISEDLLRTMGERFSHAEFVLDRFSVKVYTWIVKVNGGNESSKIWKHVLKDSADAAALCEVVDDDNDPHVHRVNRLRLNKMGKKVSRRPAARVELRLT